MTTRARKIFLKRRETTMENASKVVLASGLCFSGGRDRRRYRRNSTGATFHRRRSHDPLHSKASDEADGNTGRPQPGFFRITGKNISYSTSDGLGRGILFRYYVVVR